MTLSIDFSPQELTRLRERAAQAGKDLDAFIHDAAMATVDRPTLAQILAPVHEATVLSGVTVDEIDQMADRARAEVRRERHANVSI